MTEHLTTGTGLVDGRAFGRPGRSRSRGQSLIVAVIVLFVLLFLGGVFVGIVAHNMISQGRAADTLSAAQLAEAGANYAGEQLLNSLDGADWRPAPTPCANAQDPDRPWLDRGFSRISLPSGRALIRVSYKVPVPNGADPPLVRANFPGYQNTSTLDPEKDPTILIESVGRVGQIDESDPTTFLNVPAPRLRRVVIAKMAIGLTDYLRYVTNINEDSEAEALIGVPPISIPNPASTATALPLWMQLGLLPVRTPDGVSLSGVDAPGAPMQINCNLKLMHNVVLGLNPDRGESVNVAGTIRVESGSTSSDPADPSPRSARFNNIALYAANADPVRDLPQILPSSATNFNTFGQLLMDSSINTLFDTNGYPRRAKRLDPPAIDRVDPATGVARYLRMSRDSGVALPRNAPTFNTGGSGYGAGVYVPLLANERRSGTPSNAWNEALRQEWLSPGARGPWNGPFYVPDGVLVEFGYFVVNDPESGQAAVKPGFRLTRPDGSAFSDPLGEQVTNELVYSFFIYKPAGQRPVLKLDNPLFRRYLRRRQDDTNVLPAGSGTVEQRIDRFLPPFNGVIYAAGNIRTRGLLPSKAAILNDSTRTDVRRDPDDHSGMTENQLRAATNPPAITMVSGRNIYIEGSLVREPSGPDTMLALMAQENVVVNTTMFVGPADQRSPAADSEDGVPFFPLESGNSMSLQWLFGADPTQYTSMDGGNVSSYLLLRSGVNAGSYTYWNLAVNEALPPVAPATMFYPFNILSDAPTVYPLPHPGAPTASTSLYEQRAFTLCTMPPASGHAISGADYSFTGLPNAWPLGLHNTLRFANDPYSSAPTGSSGFKLSRAAVVPNDVRIEALIYAQNGSFFVIPGRPMNEVPYDDRDRIRSKHLRPDVGGSLAWQADVYDMYPFYNEPIDVRITVVGAIAENRTAPEGDQAAWMQLWGWIPENYGSTGMTDSSTNPIRIPREHLHIGDIGNTPADYRSEAEKGYYGSLGITRGLRYIYEPAFHMPFSGYTSSGSAFRVDDYGRVLPPIPRLPVCPKFVHFGEVR